MTNHDGTGLMGLTLDKLEDLYERGEPALDPLAALGEAITRTLEAHAFPNVTMYRRQAVLERISVQVIETPAGTRVFVTVDTGSFSLQWEWEA